MSLADQQWCPTSVQVTVLQARGLRIKGKSGTNDAYAVMQVGKEKYQTSVVEKSVAPVWKEEASFDLPPLHQGGTERSTLHVHVLHRALVGPDKLLGQAVINLLQLSEDKSRDKTEWFKLLDKSGKADKDRGEVLLDIQFMRNNMTASMFDLSAAGKSRSRLGKFKDKVRGKKKETDSASNIVPSLTQVLTDSEDEANGDGEVRASKEGKNKKHKMKSLFSPKSNLQKNMSQSMSVLPVKNSLLSSSQSSGLNVDPSEGKKKFKFMIHKRSGSSDSKDSGHQKQVPVEQSNLCINGSHIYCEEPQPRASRIGSNFSLASSGHGSMEDVPENSPPSVDSLRAVTQYSAWTEEEEDMAEEENVNESRRMEDERMEEERRRKEEEKRLERQIDEERRQVEEEERRAKEEKVKREKEDRMKREEEKRRQEEEERMRREEEKRRQEEKGRQEEEERMRRKEEEEKMRREEEKRREEEEERMRREEEEQRMRKEEKIRREEEERIRREEEEERMRNEVEKKRQEEEERMRREEEKRRQEEEERMRREEEEEKMRREEEEQRMRKEEKIRREEEERIRREEEERIRREEEEQRMRREEEEQRMRKEEEKIRREEEERIRREEEEERMRNEVEKKRQEEERLKNEEEIRRQVEEQKRREEERRRREKEEERMRKEEDKKRQEEEEREKQRRQEEERRLMEVQKLRKEEEDRRMRKEEEKRQKEEEEMLRRQEEEQEKKRRQEEQEKRKEQEEEHKRLMEEERKAEEKLRREEEEEKIRVAEEQRRKEEEEERVRRQEELKEKRRLEEEERKRAEQEKMKQEEEQRQHEEEERIRKEKQERMEEERKRREEEEEKARKEKEEMERLAETRRQEQEKKRIEEEEKVRREEEERIRREERAEKERKEEEAKSLEKERLTREAEEQEKRENKVRAAGRKSTVRHPAEVISTNPFDDNFPCNPSESPSGPHSSGTGTGAQPRCQSGVSSVGSKTVDEKDLIGSQREKRPAPQPPGRNQTKTVIQKEQDVSLQQTQINKQNKDAKTVSVHPQRSVQMIAPLSRSPADAASNTTKGTAAKHSKRPAPSKPRSAEQQTTSEPKPSASSDRDFYGYNPFEDDEDELPDDASKPCTTAPVKWPPAVSASEDGASQMKIKSSKMAHAPLPPAVKNDTSVTHSIAGGGSVVADNKPQVEVISTVQVQESALKESQQKIMETHVKKEEPPVASRRLQPVKPLNPLEQQSVSDLSGALDKTKVNDTGVKRPYSQLTREELISLVLKQEKQLSERDNKISELEQYIDNLLVRVIEEQPSILMSINSLKKAA